MDNEKKLQYAAQSFRNAEEILRNAADAYPALVKPCRAFSRMANQADRPLRIGILGEARSGKSSLANLLAGEPVLPVLSPAVTLPVLLTHAPEPFAAAIFENGERVAFPVLQSVAQTLAFIQASAGLAGKSIPGGSLKLLEVGFPSEFLRSAEILELPAGHPGVPGYGIDVAVWTTIATRAWSDMERIQWTKLPRSIRLRGLLAVTFCDLDGGRKNDLKQLRAILETSANPYFQGICFIANGDADPSAAAARNKALFVQLQYLALQFAARRLAKAMAVAHRAMAKAAAKHDAVGVSGIRAVANTGGLLVGDEAATLRLPLPEARPSNRITLRHRLASRTAARRMTRRLAETCQSPATGERTRRRRAWAVAGATAAVACALIMAVIQSQRIGTETNVATYTVPSASKAVERSTGAAETPRQPEAEVAASDTRETAPEAVAAGEQGEVQTQTALAGEPERVQPEPAAGEVQMAQIEPAGEPKTRKKAEAARRRIAERRGHTMAVASLAPHQFPGLGPGTLDGR